MVNLIYINKSVINIKMQKLNLRLIVLRVIVAIFIVSMMPITYLGKFMSVFMVKIIRYCIQKIQLLIILLIPKQIITKINNYAYSCKNIQSQLQTHRRQVQLNPTTKQARIMDICQLASSSPHKMTPNHKILLLMERMDELEENVFSQSKHRCQIQKQLFGLKVEMMSKDMELDHIRQENLRLKREMEILRGEIEGKQFEVEQYEDIAEFLQEEVGDFKAQLRQLGRGYKIST